MKDIKESENSDLINIITPNGDNNKEERYGEYLLINQIYKTKSGELLLVSKDDKDCKDNKKYILNKIEIINDEMKLKIEKEIHKINQIDSKFIMKINEYFIINKEEKKFFCIILNYYENKLFNIIYETNFLISRYIWKIFVQIIFGLNSLNSNGILPNYLFPESIFIDEDNNIKIGGIGISLDIVNKSKDEKDLLSYISPEIIKGEKNDDEKNFIWSAGCILYELFFKSRAFDNKNYKKLEHSILQIDYNLPYDGDKELNIIIPKLLCEKNKRATIKELIFNGIFKNKIIETNLFNEVGKPNIQGK